MAALVNGLTLWLIVGVILHEAYQRFSSPPQVQSLGMLVIATVGLAVNVAAGAFLYSSRRESLNARSAFLHVLGDAIGSVGTIIAALIMPRTRWYLADPLVSILITGIILYTSWGLIKESVDILMQSVPEGISLNEVQRAMESVNGVLKVHDLHIWTVTSGVYTLSAHAVVIGDRNVREVLNETEKILGRKFNIRHTTIQLETENREAEEFEAF